MVNHYQRVLNLLLLVILIESTYITILNYIAIGKTPSYGYTVQFTRRTSARTIIYGSESIRRWIVDMLILTLIFNTKASFDLECCLQLSLVIEASLLFFYLA